MLTATQLKLLLKTHHLRLIPRLGQHHLIDEGVIQRVVERCRLSPRDTVVEIGAGLGALTEGLSQRAGRVIAVELDRRIAGLLAARMSPRRNVTVVCGDILDFSWERVRDVTVVGAIPYQITSPIIVSLCEGRRSIAKAVLIIQDEVARRLLATPGTKAYGRLSVLGQYSWEMTSLLRVPRSAFFPQPVVDSRCVQFLARECAPVSVNNQPLFFDVVKAAFSHRRKTLVNCLRGFCPPSRSSMGRGREGCWGLSRAEAEAIVKELGLLASIRGEALSLEQLASLANALCAVGRFVPGQS